MADDKVMSLFEEAEIPQITVVNRNDPAADNNLIRCHWVNYEDTTMEEPLSLFDGYQDLKVISFSYNFGFVARITEKFEEAQIILGAEFVASKLNQTLANQMDEILATADELRLSLHRNKRRMMVGPVQLCLLPISPPGLGQGSTKSKILLLVMTLPPTMRI